MINSSTDLPAYKVIIVGDGNVGKTSLVRRYCDGKFDADSTRAVTGAVDFQTKIVTVAGKTLRLAIWDVAGDRLVSFHETFYRGAHAAALIYDVTAPASFFNLVHWHDEVQNSVPLLPMVVIGNKSDLPAIVPADEARGWARSMNMPFLLTSAATGAKVNDCFAGLAYLAMQEQQRRDDDERAQQLLKQMIDSQQKS